MQARSTAACGAAGDDPQPAGLAVAARRLLEGASTAAVKDRAGLLATFVAVRLLGASQAPRLASVLGVSERTAWRLLRAYGAAWGAAGDSLAAADPPRTTDTGVSQGLTPMAGPRGGEGGGLPAGSLTLPPERDPIQIRTEPDRARSARALTEGGSAGARRIPTTAPLPERARKAAARHLRFVRRLRLQDRMRCMGWLMTAWEETGGGVDHPVSWAVSVVDNRATALGLQPMTAAEWAAEMVREIPDQGNSPGSTPPGGSPTTRPPTS